MAKFGIELIIIFLAVFQSLGFIITYIVSVNDNHVTPGFPYISDTGGKPPESCIFALVCSISGIIGFVIVYIRFQHVHQYYKSKVQWLNIISVVVGALSVLGILIVGAFQDNTVPIAHLGGAMMVFGFGNAYMWIQTVLSYRIYHANLTRHISSIVIVTRLVISIICTFLFIATICFAQTASHFLKHNENKHGGTFIWHEDDGGFPFHLASTITEWGLGIGFLLYFVTFHPDFVKIDVSVSILLRSQESSHETVTESSPLMM